MAQMAMGHPPALVPFLFFCLLLLSSFPSSFPSSSALGLTEFNVTTPSQPEAEDWFGTGIGVSGRLLVVGSANGNGKVPHQGTAYLFSCASFPCTQVAKLTASDGAQDDFFGFSVAISGTRVVVGAFSDQTTDATGSTTNSGSAYLFDCSSSPCTQLTKIMAPDYAAGDTFGDSVATSGDLVASSAHMASANQGAVYVFNCPSSSCTLITKISIPFTFFLAMAFEGGRLVLGALSSPGRAYLFDCNPAVCVPGATLSASDPAFEAHFGSSVAISGQLVIIGTCKTNTGKGAAYVYQCTSASSCTERDMLIISEGTRDEYFGVKIATSDSLVALGVPGVNSLRGAVYLFDCLSFPCTFLSKLLLSEGFAGDLFGWSVALMDRMVAASNYGMKLEEASGSVKWFDPTSVICNCSSIGSLGFGCSLDSARTCTCKAGFQGSKCDHCQPGRSGPFCSCPDCVHGTCNEGPSGSYSCVCYPGFTLNQISRACLDDINECTLRTDNCHKDATCTNTFGSFTCTCKYGFIQQATDCIPDSASLFEGIDWIILEVYAGIFLLSILIFLTLRKLRPDANNSAILTLAFSIFDVTTDTFFVIDCRQRNEMDLFVSSLFFLVFPAALNLIVIFSLIISELKSDPKVEAWVYRNYVSTAAVIVVGVTNVEILSLLDSQILGLEVFSIAWGERSSARIKSFGLLGNVLEDIPQLVIQIIYLTRRGWNGIVVASLIASTLALLLGMVKRMLLALILHFGVSQSRPKGETAQALELVPLGVVED